MQWKLSSHCGQYQFVDRSKQAVDDITGLWKMLAFGARLYLAVEGVMKLASGSRQRQTFTFGGCGGS